MIKTILKLSILFSFFITSKLINAQSADYKYINTDLDLTIAIKYPDTPHETLNIQSKKIHNLVVDYTVKDFAISYQMYVQKSYVKSMQKENTDYYINLFNNLGLNNIKKYNIGNYEIQEFETSGGGVYSRFKVLGFNGYYIQMTVNSSKSFADDKFVLPFFNSLEINGLLLADSESDLSLSNYNFEDALTESTSITNSEITPTVTNSGNTTITPSSDIDINIPASKNVNENTFAVIIGNEDYQNEIKVKYAKNDAFVFKQYVEQTLGVPAEQIHYVENATYGNILSEIYWIKSVAKAYTGTAKLIFYYAGHGMPNETTKEAFILPTDGNASQTATAISLDQIYSSLNEYPTQQVVVFLDACFSGAAREGMLATGRGVSIKPKTDVPKGNMVVFTAVTEGQTAHPYDNKQHGLFSYYLMKKLQETQGNITFGELGDYIKTEVNKKSVISGKEQQPQVNVSLQLQNNWRNMTLK